VSANLLFLALLTACSTEPEPAAPPTGGATHAPGAPGAGPGAGMPGGQPAGPPPEGGLDAGELAERANALFQPLPEWMGDRANEATVALGRQLYYEKRLSKNHDISCNSCHQLDRFGVDGEPTSPGHKGQRGGRNSPTSLNAALHVAQFWDGRAATVEDQAKGPILNPIEMALPDEATAVANITSIPGYPPLFEAAFGDDAVTYDRIADAIGAFERGLVSPSPFDKMLAGELTALNHQQLKGLETFMDVGCTACHNGVGVGGAGYFKLGLVTPYETADNGRHDLTGAEADKHVFKAPSLRNITKTGPYLHDGSVGSLDEVVKIMGRHQLGKELDASQTGHLIQFLDALTGVVPAAYVKAPETLPSGPTTPAADPS
jgi:cytochrome c peroxidase